MAYLRALLRWKREIKVSLASAEPRLEAFLLRLPPKRDLVYTPEKCYTWWEEEPRPGSPLWPDWKRKKYQPELTEMETGKKKEQLRTFSQSFWWNTIFHIHVSVLLWHSSSPCSALESSALELSIDSSSWWAQEPWVYCWQCTPFACLYVFLGHLLISHQLMQHTSLAFGHLYIKRPLGRVLRTRALSKRRKNEAWGTEGWVMEMAARPWKAEQLISHLEWCTNLIPTNLNCGVLIQYYLSFLRLYSSFLLLLFLLVN